MISAEFVASKATDGKVDLSFEKFYLGKNAVLVEDDWSDIFLGLPYDYCLDYNFDFNYDF